MPTEIDLWTERCSEQRKLISIRNVFAEFNQVIFTKMLNTKFARRVLLIFSRLAKYSDFSNPLKDTKFFKSNKI